MIRGSKGYGCDDGEVAGDDSGDDLDRPQLEVAHNASPPPPVNPPMDPLVVSPRQIEDQWLLKSFRDCNSPIFKRSTNAKEAEDWLCEIERVFKVMECAEAEKLLLAEFSLKSEAQVWWEVMG